MMPAVRKIIRSCLHALYGIRYAYRNDESFRMEAWGSVAFAAVALGLWPLTSTEILLLALAYFLILITELSNTALETAWRRLHPEHHELVGASKDVSSSAVLLAFVFAALVVTVLVFVRIL